MPRTPAQQRGMEFEADVCRVLGLKTSPGSGNKWDHKGDGSGGIRVSSKSTSKRTWGETRRQLDEAIEFCAGTGDLPALAIEEPEDGERLVVMRLVDFAELRERGGLAPRPSTRAEMVRQRSSVPVLLRVDGL